MAKYLGPLFFVVLLLILHHILADQSLGILDDCKNSCERSYPLHTYPKVSFLVHRIILKVIDITSANHLVECLHAETHGVAK